MEIQKETPLALSNFRVVRHVTRPLLKMIDNQKYYVKITDAIFQADQVKNPKKVKQIVDGIEVEVPIAPPFIIFADDLGTGTPVQLVANDVLKSELEKQYKDKAYVGKFFELVKNTKAEGKRYNTFGITELAPVEPETTGVVQTEAAKDTKKK